MALQRTYLLGLVALLSACPAPEEAALEVGYRDGLTSTGQNGERGNVMISEVLWSGSVKVVDGERIYDPTDIFIELRNTGLRPLDVQGWFLEVRGAERRTWRLPMGEPIPLPVAGEVWFAAKTDGCFPEPDAVIEGLELPLGDPFSITLRDADERLINGAGDYSMPPFAGGYDLVMSRSMEMTNIMFGARGNYPHAWHHWTDKEPADWRPDRDPPYSYQQNMLESCREFTGASPGVPNSPDYAGSFASGATD